LFYPDVKSRTLKALNTLNVAELQKELSAFLSERSAPSACKDLKPER
jgi:hypothetical protein